MVTKKELATRCSKETDKIVALVQTITKNYVEIGRILTKIRDEGIFHGAGSHVKTFDDYLVDIGMRRTTAYNCIAIFERFFPFFKRDIPDYTRLVHALPLVKKDPKTAEEWADKALHLKTTDYYEELQTARGKASRTECKHGASEIVTRCVECGKILQVESGGE